jgi:hypothetical protein
MPSRDYMKFKFPGVPQAKWKKEDIFKPMDPSGIPNYKLVDAQGKVLAEGEEAKARARELAGAGAKEESAGTLSK